mgnify:CR=1 FL=1|tara:strand:+ start:2139 stop:2393 length:255 start_codon:yes stop_codon:yes gene_type:complete
MKAVNNYIIIKGIKEEKKTDSGFIMKDDKTEFRYLKGEVVSIGEKTEAIKCLDIIHYDRNAGHEIIFDNKTYIVIKQQDVVIVE